MNSFFIILLLGSFLCLGSIIAAIFGQLPDSAIPPVSILMFCTTTLIIIGALMGWF